MVDAINRRVEYAKEHGARIATKGKNDTVIVRPLVVQLDSDSIIFHLFLVMNHKKTEKLNARFHKPNFLKIRNS